MQALVLVLETPQWLHGPEMGLAERMGDGLLREELVMEVILAVLKRMVDLLQLGGLVVEAVR